MNKYISVYFFIAIHLLLLFNFGFSGQSEDPQKVDAPKIRFPKVENYNVVLECLTRNLEFRAGEKAELTFGMKNIGKKSFICYEWRMDEASNLAIDYTDWDGKTKLKKEDVVWKRESTEFKGQARIMPLELAPNNTVLIKRCLEFTEKIPKDIKEPKFFLIRPSLNLNTMSAEGKVFKITIIPNN